MTTTAVFDLLSDDDDLREQVAAIGGDEVARWSLAVFVCTMMRDRAVKAQAIREHYDAIHMRARRTRAERIAAQLPVNPDDLLTGDERRAMDADLADMARRRRMATPDAGSAT